MDYKDVIRDKLIAALRVTITEDGVTVGFEGAENEIEILADELHRILSATCTP